VPLNLAWSFGPIRDTPGVCRGQPFLLSGNGQPVVLDEDDVGLLRKIEYTLAHPIAPAATLLPYKVGDRVMVVDGAFADRIGRIAELDDAERITLLMDIFGRKTRAFVSASQIVAAN
jgi:transcription antitermination factor NusG